MVCYILVHFFGTAYTKTNRAWGQLGQALALQQDDLPHGPGPHGGRLPGAEPPAVGGGRVPGGVLAARGQGQLAHLGGGQGHRGGRGRSGDNVCGGEGLVSGGLLLLLPLYNFHVYLVFSRPGVAGANLQTPL